MSELSRFKQFLIIVTLLGLLIFAVYSRAAEIRDDVLLIDPTAPLVSVDEGATDEGGLNLLRGALLGGADAFALGSILIRAEDRIAVINNQRVRVGETVANGRVTAIEAGSVTLSVDGELLTLELYANSVKTLVKGEG